MPFSGKENLVSYAGDDVTRDQARKYRTVMMWNGSGAAIAAGAVVAVDLAVTTKGLGRAIKTADGDNAVEDQGALGGALRVIPNLSWGEIVVQGRQDLVLSVGTIAAGNQLECSDGANAGRLNIMTADPAALIRRPIAIALTASSADPGTISVEWLNPRFL